MYVSTRGGPDEVNFSKAAFLGLASDGGLLVSKNIPKLTAQQWREIRNCTSYDELAFIILHAFAPEIRRNVLWKMVHQAYAPERFSSKLEGDDPNEIVSLCDLGEGLRLLRLWHGPTAAFKDLPLQFFGELIEHLLAVEAREINFFGSTSGDTGVAAIMAMLGRSGVRVFMCSPREGMSPFQAHHMWGVCDPGIHNLMVDNFDQGQRLVKEVSGDADFKKRFSIGAVNSINLVRVLAQVVYSFWAGLKLNGLNGQPFDVAVPTGNFGDIFSVYLAKRMGLPVRRLILATNANNVLEVFFNTGIYRPSLEVLYTLSPSMNIQEASNFERYLYYLFDGDVSRVAACMEELRQTGCIDLSGEMAAIRATGFVAVSVSDEECLVAIRETHARTGHIPCPHTATAMVAAERCKESGVPCVVYATAASWKFDEATLQAIDMKSPRPEAFEGMEERPVFTVEVASNAGAFKRYIEKHCS